MLDRSTTSSVGFGSVIAGYQLRKLSYIWCALLAHGPALLWTGVMARNPDHIQGGCILSLRGTQNVVIVLGHKMGSTNGLTM
jgi:hypothetical protein